MRFAAVHSKRPKKKHFKSQRMKVHTSMIKVLVRDIQRSDVNNGCASTFSTATIILTCTVRQIFIVPTGILHMRFYAYCAQLWCVSIYEHIKAVFVLTQRLGIVNIEGKFKICHLCWVTSFQANKMIKAQCKHDSASPKKKYFFSYQGSLDRKK